METNFRAQESVGTFGYQVISNSGSIATVLCFHTSIILSVFQNLSVCRCTVNTDQK